MTTSTHTTTSLGSGSTDNDGGVIVNAGTIAGSKFTAKSPIDINGQARSSGAKVLAVTGTAYRAGIAKSNSSGTLAFFPSTRTSSVTGFVIRGGVGNEISGVSSLNPIFFAGSDKNRNAGNLHKKTAHYSKGTWATLVFDVFGGGLLQSDGTAKSGATGYGSSNAITGDFPSRSTPGEFYILQNFVSFTGTSVSGDGTGSENMMDYSAVTGG
tara:strand:+ start:247 stop:882 length:636 start_codon:yes stop_codon:yes gene_type:complete